jgi:hypothetical protein
MDRHVVVGVDGGRAIVRRDDYDFAAVVAAFGYVVIPLDGGIDGVVGPDDDEVREEPVVRRGDGLNFPR